MFNEFEHVKHEQSLRKVGLVGLKKKTSGDLLSGGSKKMETDSSC